MSATLCERRPGSGWTDVSDRLPPIPASAISAWTNGHAFVISAIADMTAPDGSGDVIPQWHVSITEHSARPSERVLRVALAAFDMTGSEEDNHHPGRARHFFLPVDPARRVDCECKADETTVCDVDGYTWTNPAEGPCRGCEHARVFGTPCPLHARRPCPHAYKPRSCEVRS